MLAFVTYALGFAARPLGGLVFGHFGDRIGRKKLLVLSLLLMGGATFADRPSCRPTPRSASPRRCCWSLLRLVQGFALGGEWGGAVLMVSEHGDAERRGFWASWPQAGVPGRQPAGGRRAPVLSAVQSDADFLAWGWRVPFLLSARAGADRLWVRLSHGRVARSSSRRCREGARPARSMPVLEVVREHPREVLIAMGMRMAENISYYVFTTFVLTYAHHVHLPQQTRRSTPC